MPSSVMELVLDSLSGILKVERHVKVAFRRLQYSQLSGDYIVRHPPKTAKIVLTVGYLGDRHVPGDVPGSEALRQESQA